MHKKTTLILISLISTHATRCIEWPSFSAITEKAFDRNTILEKMKINQQQSYDQKVEFHEDFKKFNTAKQHYLENKLQQTTKQLDPEDEKMITLELEHMQHFIEFQNNQMELMQEAINDQKKLTTELQNMLSPSRSTVIGGGVVGTILIGAILYRCYKK